MGLPCKVAKARNNDRLFRPTLRQLENREAPGETLGAVFGLFGPHSAVDVGPLHAGNETDTSLVDVSTAISTNDGQDASVSEASPFAVALASAPLAPTVPHQGGGSGTERRAPSVSVEHAGGSLDAIADGALLKMPVAPLPAGKAPTRAVADAPSFLQNAPGASIEVGDGVPAGPRALVFPPADSGRPAAIVTPEATPLAPAGNGAPPRPIPGPEHKPWSRVGATFEDTSEEGDSTSPQAHFTGTKMTALNSNSVSDDLWWFGGVTPANYPTAILLQLTNLPQNYGDAQWRWTITAGTNIVEFSSILNGGVLYGASGTATGLRSLSGSVAPNDVSIQVEASWDGAVWGGGWSCTMTVCRPNKLVANHDWSDSVENLLVGNNLQLGYRSVISYTALDQFGNALPRDIEFNEKLGAIVEPRDWVGSTWVRGGESAAMGAPTQLRDTILVTSAPDWVPQSNNPGPRRNPPQPMDNTKVDHFTQEWRVGSLTIGQGYLIQTDIIQRYTDHARHESVQSPA
jgi:hypothetical protein